MPCGFADSSDSAVVFWHFTIDPSVCHPWSWLQNEKMGGRMPTELGITGTAGDGVLM